MSKNRPFRTSGLVGLLVIGMSVIMLFNSPKEAHKLPTGFSNPIVALEFAQTPQEVIDFFNYPDKAKRDSLVGLIRLNTTLDYVYLFLYPALLFLFSVTAVKLTSRKIYYLAAALAVFALVGDGLENLQMFKLTSLAVSSIETSQAVDFAPWLSRLAFFTWLKWGSLATIFLLLSSYFWKGDFFAKLIAATGVITFVVATLAFINRSSTNEILLQLIALMFLLMIIYCFTKK